jgi:hypothetical protein
MKITIISTFSPKHYKIYGRYFVESLQKFLDNRVNVVLYTDTPLTLLKSNFSNRILNECCPNLVEFKKRNGDKIVSTETKGWLKDAVRFSHKSYCIVHASRTIETDLLIRLDADTEIIAPITHQYLSEQLDPDYFVSYLGRPNRYTETGWLCFDLRNKWSKKFFDRWEWYYNTDEIYNLPAQLDCYVFDAVREEMEISGKIKGQNISPPNLGSQHFDRKFIGKMTHYKGDKKDNRDQNLKIAKIRARKK